MILKHAVQYPKVHMDVVPSQMLLAAKIFVIVALMTWCAEKEVSVPDGLTPSPRRHLQKRWPGGRPRLSVLMGSLSVPMATPVAKPQTVLGVVVP